MSDRRRLGWLAGGAGLALVALIGAACSGSDGDGEPTVQDDHNGAENAVHVSLTEWSIAGEGGDALHAVAAGDVTFEVHNDGTTPHNLVVIQSDTNAADLPVVDSAVDENEAGEVVHRTADLDVDGVESFSVELEAGQYVLICNILGHYERDMFVELVVE